MRRVFRRDKLSPDGAKGSEGNSNESPFIRKKDLRFLQNHPSSRKGHGDLQPVEKA
jgi:hypothetical protein